MAEPISWDRHDLLRLGILPPPPSLGLGSGRPLKYAVTWRRVRYPKRTGFLTGRREGSVEHAHQESNQLYLLH